MHAYMLVALVAPDPHAYAPEAQAVRLGACAAAGTLRERLLAGTLCRRLPWRPQA